MKSGEWLLGVLLCVLSPSLATAYEYQGMSYVAIYGGDEDQMAKPPSDQSLLNMKNVGVNSVAINVWWFQDTITSTSMHEDFSRYSSTQSSVAHAIDTAHSLGMKVMLKPMLDVNDGTWRAEINPTDKETWFANYTHFLGTFADLAQQKGVELFSLGCEMNTLEATSNNASWTNLITNIRSRYDGKLTYAANWSPNSSNLGGYKNVTWWNQLDVIGIDAYFPIATNNNPTVASMTATWNTEANKIESWLNSSGLNKNVIFTEVGYESANGTGQQPWGVDNPQPDLQEQADAYQAMLNVMPARTWWDGAFWWNWEADPTPDDILHNGYTPQNKPAQAILEEFYAGVSPGVTGDFNLDNRIDAADYVAWRKGFGTIYTYADRNAWKANFGKTLGSGTSSSQAPEPATVSLVIMAAFSVLLALRRWRIAYGIAWIESLLAGEG